MRKLSEKVKAGQLPSPDLVVSELLGSFGDNELSPECLDSITDILRPTTISIPQQYTSYIGEILFRLVRTLITGIIKLSETYQYYFHYYLFRCFCHFFFFFILELLYLQIK